MSTSSPEIPAPSVDVVGIGNALVDVITHASPEFVAEQDIVPGSMNLIEEDRAGELYTAMGPGLEMSGGSAANTMVGVASLGGSARYLGRVLADQLGSVFVHDIRSVGVDFPNALATTGPSTGCCLILVTPDAQRTMNTFLGASALFAPSDVDPAIVQSGRIVYLEGYLFDRPEAQEAYRLASEAAHAAGRTVALTLSDSFCVDRHRDEFRDLLEHHVDVVFANEAELCSLYETPSFDGAKWMVRGHCPLAVVTRGEKGSVVLTNDEMIEVPAEPVAQLVDTTGAGDLFAAGFLYGLARDLPHETCARLGAVAAAEVISHVGARPMRDLAELAAPVLAG
jgi:sugar/nucleoside kinase (ribokinase family)